jgi:hypothetical protein
MFEMLKICEKEVKGKQAEMMGEWFDLGGTMNG